MRAFGRLRCLMPAGSRRGGGHRDADGLVGVPVAALALGRAVERDLAPRAPQHPGTARARSRAARRAGAGHAETRRTRGRRDARGAPAGARARAGHQGGRHGHDLVPPLQLVLSAPLSTLRPAPSSAVRFTTTRRSLATVTLQSLCTCVGFRHPTTVAFVVTPVCALARSRAVKRALGPELARTVARKELVCDASAHAAHVSAAPLVGEKRLDRVRELQSSRLFEEGRVQSGRIAPPAVQRDAVV